MVRVAMLGLGYWGPNLVRNLASIENAAVVALCDLDTARAETFRRKLCPAAKVVGDVRLIADDPEVDAVVIATPIRTHHALASCLLQAGKHVLVEKPLASTADECLALIDLAEKAQRLLMVGHVFEYNAAVRMVKQYLDRGDLGRVLYVYSQRVNLGRIQRDTSALWSFAPHDISILNYWFGQEPVRVAARGFSCLHTNVEDVVFVTLEYPDAVGAHLHLGWLDPRKVRLMTVVGSKKMLVYDDVSPDAKIQIYDKGVAAPPSNLNETPGTFAEFQVRLRVGDLTVPSISFSEPLQVECQHFVDCIERGERPFSDGQSGLRTVRVLEAAEQSLRRDGAPITIRTT